MEALGDKIAAQRAKHGLTQKDLGEKLNVTAQAVSKWENGQSEPDIDALKSMSVIFGVSLDELVGNESAAAKPQEAAVAEQEEKPAEQAAPVETKIINGYCNMCKKPVGPDEYVVHNSRRSSTIYCLECNKKHELGIAKSDYNDYVKHNKLALGWGIAAAVVMLAVLLPSLICNNVFSLPANIIIPIVLALGAFAFVAQAFWGGAVLDIFMFFVHTFKMPGVIFSFSLGGIAFLIVIKILFAILGAILSVLWFLLGVLVVCPVLALLMFPFVLPGRISEGTKLQELVEKLEAEAEKAKTEKAETAAQQ